MKVPKYIEKSVKDMAKYHVLHVESFNVFFEWAKRNNMVVDDQFIYYKGEFIAELTDIEQGHYSDETLQEIINEIDLCR